MPVQTVGTPSELPLVSPNSEIVPPFPNENGNNKVQMKKQLGLLEGVSIILGIIFGSGNSHICSKPECSKQEKFILRFYDSVLRVFVYVQNFD